MNTTYKSPYKTWKDFGVTELSKITGYKGGKIPSWMLKGNGYAGKQLWYERKLYTCIESTTNTVYININGDLTRVHREKILAPKNTIPQYKAKTRSEILKEIQVNYPNASLSIPKVGCQLHGDIDAVLRIDDEEYWIPWNY